jgi:alkylation response protein AidB-like acyl-CoA dehydrogenase
MPHILSMAFEEYMASSNMAFAMYPGLTHGAVSAILVKGSDELKAIYAPNMISGKWTGTMNLTEPHCGTDLGLIRTRPCPMATAAMRSPAPRSSFRRASMT